MLAKPGKPRNDPNSYRPISLLSSVSKICEKIIYKLINDHLNKNTTLPNEQYGFRKQHNATHQICRLTEHILQNFTHSKKTGAIFLDVAKAFDKVCHNRLLYKLIKIGLPTAITKLIKSYLMDKKFIIKINEEQSTSTEIRAGVPQGSVLGPLLYLIYVADIPTSPNTNIAIFADDTAIYTSSKKTSKIVKDLNEHLETIQKWASFWNIKLNEDKTQAILFKNKKEKTVQSTPKTKIGNTLIPWSSSVKYLGVTLDRNLTFKQHTDNVSKKTKQIRGYLYPLLNPKNKLDINNKRKIYLMTIRPIMTYAAPTFGQATNQIRKRQTIQNKSLRLITGAPWYMSNEQLHNELKIPTIDEYIKKLTRNLYEKMENHNNPTIRQITDYDTNQEKIKKIKRP